MTQKRDMRPSITSFLSRTGWSASSSGQGGELWTLSLKDASNPGSHTHGEGHEQSSRTLAVPSEVDFGSFEFESVVSRLAFWGDSDLEHFMAIIENEFTDTQSYRISDAFLVENAALLDGATTLLNSAKKLLRTAATTSMKTRARIGPNYSKRGDELVRQARLAHTRQGSFVLPVEMPVTPPAPKEGQFDDETVVVEPAERGVTRTLAAALAALDTVVIRPDRQPVADDIMGLVQNGVSKELVGAIQEVTANSGVEALDVTFAWSPALGVPKRVPERLVIPHEATPLLKEVAKTLGKIQPEPDASVSGQIVRIFYVQDEPSGEISIRTERRGRQADVMVSVDAATVHSAYEWAHDHRPVMASGRIERAPGQPLKMPKPTSVRPVDELFTKTATFSNEGE